MMKLLEYILKRGGEVQVTAIPSPHDTPASINSCLEKIFKHEVENTKAIYTLVKMSLYKQNWATWNLMQWFVKEQTEEETRAMTLPAKLKIAGGEKVSSLSLYSLDRDLEKTTDGVTSAQDVTAENP